MREPVASPMDTYLGPVRGLGVFLASGDVARLSGPTGDPAAMLDAGLRWAAIWVESYDGRRASLATVQRVAERLRGVGIEPAVWTFPAPAAAQRAGAYLAACASAIGAPLAILDVEDPDGVRGPMTWSRDDARALIDTTIDGLTERTMLAVSSYPGRRGHGLPWHELVAGVGMPQIYGTADSPQSAAAAVRSWRDAHGVVIPATSLRSPGAQDRDVPPEQLVRRLDAITPDGIDAAALWSWALLRGSAAHQRRLAAWVSARGW